MDTQEFNRLASAAQRIVRREFRGFSHKGKKSWRVRSDGLVDLVQFQNVRVGGLRDQVLTHVMPGMPEPVPAPPEGWTEAPYFAVNLGVWIPEITGFEFPWRDVIPPDIADCHAQTRLPHPGAQEPWRDLFSVTGGVARCSDQVIEAWRSVGEAFFAMYPHRESFVTAYYAGMRVEQVLSGARAVVILLVLHGRRDEARKVIDLEVARSEDKPGYVRSLNELARKLGV